MPAHSKPTKRSTRKNSIELHLTPSALDLLQEGAKVQRKTLAEFVLDSAMGAAADVVTGPRVFTLNSKQWKAFMQALDAPPRRHARLERLLRGPSVFD
jgi:uncharacterized protein (DUF1778 family)